MANCAHLNGKVHAMPALIKRLHRINAMQLGRATAQRVAGRAGKTGSAGVCSKSGLCAGRPPRGAFVMMIMVYFYIS